MNSSKKYIVIAYIGLTLCAILFCHMMIMPSYQLLSIFCIVAAVVCYSSMMGAISDKAANYAVIFAILGTSLLFIVLLNHIINL